MSMLNSSFKPTTLRPSHHTGVLAASYHRQLTALRPNQTDLLATKPRTSKILLIEDSTLLLEILKVIFGELVNECDTRLVEAYNGQMGLRLILEERPDIIVFDLHMPVLSGLEMLEKLYQTELWQTGYRPHLVALTAEVQPEIIEQTLAMGVANYYTKPFNSRALLNKMRDLLQNGNSVGEERYLAPRQQEVS